MDRQHLHFRTPGHEPLAAVEDVSHMLGVRGDHGNSDDGASVQIELTDLGDGYGEPSPKFGEQGSDDAALALQRVHITE